MVDRAHPGPGTCSPVRSAVGKQQLYHTDFITAGGSVQSRTPPLVGNIWISCRVGEEGSDQLQVPRIRCIEEADRHLGAGMAVKVAVIRRDISAR